MNRPTADQLREALQVSGLRHISLEAALQSRTLAIGLTNTAHAIAKRRSSQKTPITVDLKRLAAGDID